MKALYQLYYKDLFLCPRLLGGLAGSVILFLLSFFYQWLGDIPSFFFLSIILLLIVDIILLYKTAAGVFARRITPDRLSNSDENEISIYVKNFYPFKVGIKIIDELPVQFQIRNILFKSNLDPNQNKTIHYTLRPVKRGEYYFNNIHVFVDSPLKFIRRRYTFEQNKMLPVYPSFLQMRKYELMAISNRLSEMGVKKIRRLGQSMEFEQVKNYVTGDDYRNINWKSTARRGDLMVNSFTDERSQHLYCIIDKSRSMKMPFEGMSLLDYSINAALVLSNIALLKQDKAGLITISEKIGAVLPAEYRRIQLNKILEILYKEKTRYLETNIEVLYSTIRNTLKQRSLIVYFTNFESMAGLQRQLPFLKRIARLHLLVVVFFENTELQKLRQEHASDLEQIYIKTIAEKFIYDKKQIVFELSKHGIQAILTPPSELNVNVINRYLEIKSRQRL